MNEDFNRGIWYSVQFLVVNYDMPTLAKDLIKSAQLTNENCISLQKDSGSYSEEMREFIKKELA